MGSALSREEIFSVIGEYMEIHKTTNTLPNNHSEKSIERFVRLEEGQNRIADRLELSEKRLDDKINYVEKSLNEKIDNLERSLTHRINNLELTMNVSFDLLGRRLDRQDDRIERRFNQSIAYSSGFFILITGLMTIYQFLL